MVLLTTASHLLSGVCIWSLLSTFLYYFPPLKTKLPLSHSSRLYLGGACCSFLHCSATLIATTLYLVGPQYPIAHQIAIFSCSYYLYDTAHQLYHEPQTIYLLHHATCIIGWFLILSYQQGYTLACEWLWVAELSNLPRIPWELSSHLNWPVLRQRLEEPNRLLYFFCRCILLPLHFFYRGHNLLTLSMPAVFLRIWWLLAGLFIAVGIYWRPRLSSPKSNSIP